jgi:hypothetical protein
MGAFNTRMQMLKQRAAQTAGGGTRSSGQQPNTGVTPVPGGYQPQNFAEGLAAGPHGEVFDRGNENSAVNFYQNAAREGVNAIGQGLAFDFRRELGTYLGGLNSTGALRSGAVESGANDIMRTYADRVGSAASQATLGAIGYGAQTSKDELARQQAAADRKQAQKSSTMGAVGSLLGAGVGLMK